MLYVPEGPLALPRLKRRRIIGRAGALFNAETGPVWALSDMRQDAVEFF